MSNDARDLEWRCGCGHTNPDYEDGCQDCGEERYPKEKNDSLPDLYVPVFGSYLRELESQEQEPK